MIYVCRGFQSVCRALEGGCTAAGNACGASCTWVASLCDCMFETMGEGCFCLCQAFLRPFGGYVLLSFFLGLVTLVIAAKTSSSSCQQEYSQVQTAMFINLALAAFHIFFAVYIQWKLIKTIAEDSDGNQNMAMATRMWNIVLYDVVFCIYTPVAAFSFVWGFIQPGYASDCVHEGLDGGNWAWFMGVVFVTYGMAAVSYLCCWTCVVSTCGITQGSFQSARANFMQAQARNPLVGSASQMSPPVVVAMPQMSAPVVVAMPVVQPQIAVAIATPLVAAQPQQALASPF